MLERRRRRGPGAFGALLRAMGDTGVFALLLVAPVAGAEPDTPFANMGLRIPIVKQVEPELYTLAPGVVQEEEGGGGWYLSDTLVMHAFVNDRSWKIRIEWIGPDVSRAPPPGTHCLLLGSTYEVLADRALKGSATEMLGPARTGMHRILLVVRCRAPLNWRDVRIRVSAS